MWNPFKKKVVAVQRNADMKKPDMIDISHHNKSVDLVKLKVLDRVILKATQRLDYVDEKFNSRWLGLKLLGIKRGAYHFYQCNKGDPIGQADHFLKTLGMTIRDDVLALDFETCEIKGMIQTIDDLIKHKPNALIFMKHIEKETGIKPKFYTGNNEIVSCGFEKEFAEYDLWYARYTNVEPKAKQGPWDKIWAWQYASNGVVAGVSNDVDMNYYR